MIILLLLISILPVLIVAKYIYNKDKNKEPLKLLIELFIGGIIAVFITLLLTELLEKVFPFFKIDTDQLDLLELLLSVFVGIALIEEFSKWIITYLITYKNKEFDEFYDMIVYCVFVSLGFALYENIFYVFQEGVGIGIFRAFLAVPAHAFNGIFMGYYLGLAKIASLNNNKNLEIKNKVFSIIVPILLHGVYDYCLLSGRGILYIIFIVFMISLYVFAISKVNKVSTLIGKMKYKNDFCPVCGNRVVSDYCENCGNKNE